jgi:hypothetical protein
MYGGGDSKKYSCFSDVLGRNHQTFKVPPGVKGVPDPPENLVTKGAYVDPYFNSSRALRRNDDRLRKCIVCEMDKPKIAFVNDALARGMSINVVVDMINSHIVSDDEAPRITNKNVDWHIKHCLNTKAYMQRQVIEQMAVDAGKSVENENGSLMTEFTFANMVMQQVGADLAQGKVKPTVPDGLNAAKLVKDIKKDTAANQDAITLELQTRFIANAIQKVCSKEQIETILDFVNTSMEAAAISDKYQPNAITS